MACINKGVVMIFPQLSSMYLDDTDRDIQGRMEACYTQAIMANMSFWNDADLDSRFYAGDQTVYSALYNNVPGITKRTFSFNRIKRVVNMVSGNQRKNRKQTVVVPVENGDQETADQFTKVISYIHDRENVLETISEAFEASLITGLSFLQLWVDFRNDPLSGDIKVSKCDYNSFVVDPYFRNPDMSDCNFLWKRSFLTKREIISLMPASVDIIADLYGEQMRDGKFNFMPESYGYAMKNLLTYDEFYYRDYREQTMLIDKKTGETLEWKGQDEDRLKIFLQTYPQVSMVKQTVPTVKLAILAQGKTLYDGPNPIGIDTYNFVPVFTYWQPELPYMSFRIQGIVRNLRDAQWLYSRRKVIELDMLESQINSGWKYKENALVNPADVFMSGQGKGLCLKEEAQMSDVEQIAATPIPPTTLEVSKILGQEINELAGVSEELLGTATDDKAGILSIVRQNAALVTLQPVFDQLDRSQRLLGKMMIDVISSNYMPGKIKKILGGEEPTAQFYNKAFGIYNARVEEAVLTQTQRQLEFVQLLHLREVGVPVPDDVLLETCTLQNKNDLVQRIQQQQQAQQQQAQQQQQLEMQQLAMQNELVQSQVEANKGMGIERMSRIAENQALAEERRAKAIHDEDAALLNLVKALKEIDTADLDQLQKLLTMQGMVKAQEMQNDMQQSLQPIKQRKSREKVQSRQPRQASENIMGQV